MGICGFAGGFVLWIFELLIESYTTCSREKIFIKDMGK
jgi:hypothetical protein